MTPESTTDRRYGGRTAEERRTERRERLLDAGLEEFGTTGYASTTIEGLCGAAALNVRYFYEQFSSREELLRAVYAREMRSQLEDVRRALEAATDPTQRLAVGLRAFVDGMLVDERVTRIIFLEMVGVSDGGEQERRRTRGEYIDLISEEIKRARPSAPPELGARGVAIALVGATEGLVTHWLAGECSHTRSDILKTLLAIFGPVLG